MLREKIQRLRELTADIAVMVKEKEDLIQGIVKDLKHKHDGQKSYVVDEFKLEIKTPNVYSVDRKLYESGEIKLPENFNPIKESKTYTVNKTLFNEYLETAPSDVYENLMDLITVKDGKASITIKDRD